MKNFIKKGGKFLNEGGKIREIAYLYTLGLQLLEDRLHVKWCVILSIVHGAANKQLIKDPMRYVDQVIRS